MSQTVGRYQIVEKIGQGGMGVVYKALDPLLERTVAVKLIADTVTADAESRERFLREARAAAQLAHKNIIIIYDLGEDDGRLYLAMEYLSGASLGAQLHQGRPSVARALDITIDACRGLEYAHRHDIVHRDIKPANLFVADSGDVKILDFGLARLVSSSLTRSQSVMGTVNYMAPEQVRGERIDQRADLFAMGAVLYELLAGRRAFEAESFASTMFKILEKEPEDLDSLNAAVPSSVKAIVGRALAKEALKRYQSAGEMLRDLVSCRESLKLSPPANLDDTSLPTRMVSVAHVGQDRSDAPAPSVAWSPRRVRTTAVIGGLLTLGFLSSYFWRPAQPRQSPPSESSGSGPAVEAPSGGSSVPSPPPTSSPAVPAPATQPEPSVTTALPSPPSGARGVDVDPSTRAADRGALTEAVARLGRARALAETAGAPALAGAPYQAAIALELEAQRLLTLGRLSDALAKAVEADARFRAAEIEARAEAAARERLRPVEPSTPPARPPVAEAREEPAIPVASPRGDARAPARAPEPVVPSASSEGTIREVLAQYVSGIENRNLAALRRVWPSLSGNQERAIRTEFANARAVQVRFIDPRITVNGDTGTIAGTREYNLVTQDGQRLSTVTRTTITVRRSGDGWVIERVVHQQ